MKTKNEIANEFLEATRAVDKRITDKVSRNIALSILRALECRILFPTSASEVKKSDFSIVMCVCGHRRYDHIIMEQVNGVETIHCQVCSCTKFTPRSCENCGMELCQYGVYGNEKNVDMTRCCFEWTSKPITEKQGKGVEQEKKCEHGIYSTCFCSICFQNILSGVTKLKKDGFALDGITKIADTIDMIQDNADNIRGRLTKLEMGKSELLPLLDKLLTLATLNTTIINSMPKICQKRKDEMWKIKDQCWEMMTRLEKGGGR